MMKHLVRKLRKAILDERTYKKDFIYLINEKVLAKSGSEKDVRHEYKMAKYLRKKGISIPRAYGLIKIDFLDAKLIPPFKPVTTWFFLMEKIQGKEIKELQGAELKSALRQRKRELEKVLELGITPYDALYERNSLLGKNNKLYLIDFKSWRKAPREKLDAFYLNLLQYSL